MYSGALLEVECRKSAFRCGAKHMSKSKCTRDTILGALLDELRCSKSARRCGAKHVSTSKRTKHTILGPLLELQMSYRVADARDSAPSQRRGKREGFVAVLKTLAWRGTFEEDLPRRSAGAVQETCSSEVVGDHGADFQRVLHFGASELQVS